MTVPRLSVVSFVSLGYTCWSRFALHKRIDGKWLRACNTSHSLWRGVALRDLQHGRHLAHDLVSYVPRYGLIALSVPKVASSSCRNYSQSLGGVPSASWGHVASNDTVTFALTRDPIMRFISASGTLWHRRFGDAWDTKGIKLLKSCWWSNENFTKKHKVGRFSYASAANLARCYLNVTEVTGVFWNHHVAPQLSYYVVLNPRTRLVHVKRFQRQIKVNWECEPAPSTAFSRPAACVHMPAPVHAMPMQDYYTGRSLVQHGFDHALRLRASARGQLGTSDFQPGLAMPRMPDSMTSNVQEGRYKLLNYTYLINKLGVGFALRICRLYRDDYVCLQLPAPDICRHLPGFEGYEHFYDTTFTMALPNSVRASDRMVVGQTKRASG